MPATYCGLDVSDKSTHLYEVDADGKVIWRGVCATDPAALAGTGRRVKCTVSVILVGAGADLTAQLIHNGGNWSCVKWSDVGWSALTGGLCGLALTTPLGATPLGAAAIGGLTNTLTYALTTPNGEQTTEGYGVAAVTGLAGGAIGGELANSYMFIKASPFLNDLDLAGKFVAPVSVGRGLAGGTLAAYDYLHKPACGCH